jgi:hypothetical protein
MTPLPAVEREQSCPSISAVPDELVELLWLALWHEGCGLPLLAQLSSTLGINCKHCGKISCLSARSYRAVYSCSKCCGEIVLRNGTHFLDDGHRKKLASMLLEGISTESFADKRFDRYQFNSSSRKSNIHFVEEVAWIQFAKAIEGGSGILELGKFAPAQFREPAEKWTDAILNEPYASWCTPAIFKTIPLICERHFKNTKGSDVHIPQSARQRIACDSRHTFIYSLLQTGAQRRGYPYRLEGVQPCELCAFSQVATKDEIKQWDIIAKQLLGHTTAEYRGDISDLLSGRGGEVKDGIPLFTTIISAAKPAYNRSSWFKHSGNKAGVFNFPNGSGWRPWEFEHSRLIDFPRDRKELRETKTMRKIDHDVRNDEDVLLFLNTVQHQIVEELSASTDADTFQDRLSELRRAQNTGIYFDSYLTLVDIARELRITEEAVRSFRKRFKKKLKASGWLDGLAKQSQKVGTK